MWRGVIRRRDDYLYGSETSESGSEINLQHPAYHRRPMYADNQRGPYLSMYGADPRTSYRMFGRTSYLPMYGDNPPYDHTGQYVPHPNNQNNMSFHSNPYRSGSQWYASYFQADRGRYLRDTPEHHSQPNELYSRPNKRYNNAKDHDNARASRLASGLYDNQLPVYLGRPVQTTYDNARNALPNRISSVSDQSSRASDKSSSASDKSSSASDKSSSASGSNKQ